MKVARLRVRVRSLGFGSPRWATFTDAKGQTRTLEVEDRDLEGEEMLVGILAENADEIAIQLPRMRPVGAWVAVVLRTSVTREGTRMGCLLWVLAGLLVMAAATAARVWAAT